MNFNINDLIGKLPVSDLAEKFGVSKEVMNGAIEQAVPGLLAGMATNASTEEGAEKLAAATKQHRNKPARVSEVDPEDGKKIVKKVLGSKENDVVAALGKNSGSEDIASLIPKLLPFLAPLIMQFLGGNLFGGEKDTPKSSDGGITDMLGGLLGGSSQSSAGGIGDVLGGILGGNSKSKGSSGGLGDILGGFLSGK